MWPCTCTALASAEPTKTYLVLRTHVGRRKEGIVWYVEIKELIVYTHTNTQFAKYKVHPKSIRTLIANYSRRPPDC